MKLTKNFKMEEFCRSNTAVAKGLKNVPGPTEVISLSKLAENLLQPLRDYYGKPMNVNSGFRSPEVNKAVGGVASSQHLKGQAADIRCENPRELLTLLRSPASGLMWDQAILYDDGRNRFLHLSYVDRNNRQQVLYSKGTQP